MHYRDIACIVMHRNRLIYVAGDYYQYIENVYQPIHAEQVKKIIIREIDITNEGKSVKEKFPTTQSSCQNILHYMNVACYCHPDDINAGDTLNLINGLLDPIKYKVLKHTPDVLSTLRLNVEFAKGKKCDRWLAFLAEVFEDNQSKISVLQEYFGLCLTKMQKFEKILMLFGDGANGKSVIMSILRKMLGDNNVSAVPVEFFVKPNYIALLFNKLVNISPELPAKTSLCDSVIKMITSGEAIEADKKFKDPFCFKPFCKLIISTNTLPYISDKSPAFYRRLIILEFLRTFEEHEQDKNLIAKLEEELSGIFLWALTGLKRLTERGYFELPPEMAQLIQDYKKENNPVCQYVEERLEHRANSYIGIKEAYDAYKLFCHDNNYKALSKIKFSKDILSQFRYIGKRHERAGWFFSSVAWRSDAVDASVMGVDL